MTAIQKENSMSDSSKKLLAFALIAFILWPTGGSNPVQPIKNDNTILFTRLTGEGAVASYFEFAKKEKVTVTVPEEKVVCKCNGTGKVLGPDKILMIDCPAIETGTCKSGKKPQTSKPISEQMLEDLQEKLEITMPEPEKEVALVPPPKQVIFLTMNGCINCDMVKERFGKQLKDGGFGFDEKETSLIRIVHYETDKELFQKYAKSIAWQYPMPQFVLVENGVVNSKSRLYGYQDVSKILKMFK